MKVLRNHKFTTPIGTRLWRAYLPPTATTRYDSSTWIISDAQGHVITGWIMCDRTCHYQRRIACTSGAMLIVLKSKRDIILRCINNTDIGLLPSGRYVQPAWLTEDELQRLIERRRAYNPVAEHYYRHNRLNQLPEVWHNYQPPKF